MAKDARHQITTSKTSYFELFPAMTHSVFIDGAGGLWRTEGRQTIQRVEGLAPCVSYGVGPGLSAVVTVDGDVYRSRRIGMSVRGGGGVQDIVKVEGLPPIQCVSVGAHFAMCVAHDNTVWSFGFNQHGKLGLGRRDEATYLVPAKIEGILARQVACGGGHSLILTLDGQLYGCGDGTLGQLSGHQAVDGVPVHIPLPFEIESIYCGVNLSVVLAMDGTLWISGSWDSQSHTFQKALRLPVIQVAVGFSHWVALDDQNRLWGWGRNDHGQLSPLTTDILVATVLRDDVQDVIAGSYSTFVRTTGDQIFACGEDESSGLILRPLRPGVGWTLHPNLSIDMISTCPRSRRIKSAQSDKDISTMTINMNSP